jgi:two-component system response regulator MprA
VINTTRSERRRDLPRERRRVPRGGRRGTDGGRPYPLLLVADSHGDALVPYVRYLKLFGFGVAGVADGHEVLPLIHATRPHAILMEPSLPSMPVWRLVERLSEDGDLREIPIILLAGSAPKDSNGQLPIKAAGVLLKPFPLASMVEEVRRVLRLHPPTPPEPTDSKDPIPEREIR